jgi:hypothetical protein
VGIHYTGDGSLLAHGGTFYSLAEIESGYIPCARFYGEHVDGPMSLVETGSAYLPDDIATTFRALLSIGVDMDVEGLTFGDGIEICERELPLVVAEALIAHGCVEWDDCRWYALADDWIGADDDDKRAILDDSREPLLVGIRTRRASRDRQLTESQLIRNTLRRAGLMGGNQ